MDQTPLKRISIQVSLSGYSFRIYGTEGLSSCSGWYAPGEVGSAAELNGGYDEVLHSVLTPKVTLVPEAFFSPQGAAGILSRTVELSPSDKVDCVRLEEYQAFLVYSLDGFTHPDVLLPGLDVPVPLPEMYYLLKGIRNINQYNRIAASFADGFLHLTVAQGTNLLLSNVFEAPDFTTAEYYIFLSMKKLQLNPEVSVIHFRTPLTEEQEMSLYRYFKGVEKL
ncbi:MAG: DUF3822 family protein [Candidatus Cryptobacteroides sp.]